MDISKELIVVQDFSKGVTVPQTGIYLLQIKKINDWWAIYRCFALEYAEVNL